ncbi:Ribonuclease H1 [Meloidogyne graminicola]|uniref:ribonuclease H n=1 Tax=Meloidogyne graminicola TaxID=189291 RepID=A0A8T0A2X8_9BILA|nr:Ribonuclease H1 [Meloidogyne graminicola]
MKNGIPVVYTDGACSRNGSSNPKAGIGVFWGDNHNWNVSAPVTGRATNNIAEYSAIICGIEKAISEGLTKLIIRTDSQLIINSMNLWINKWKLNGWKTVEGTDVLNKDLLEYIDNLQSKVKVYFEKVDGHSGDYNNDQADRLAKEGANMYIE